MEIHSFKSSLNPILDRDEILEDLDASKQSLISLLPALGRLEDFEEKHKSNKSTNKLVAVLKVSLKSKQHKNFSTVMRYNAGKVVESIGELEKMVNDNFSNKIPSMELTFRQSGIMSLITGLDPYVQYVSSLAVELLKTYGSKSDIYSMSRTTRTFLASHRKTYAWVANSLGSSPQTLRKELMSLSNISVNADNESLIKNTDKSFSSNPLTKVNGFIGNPIYFIRNLFSGWKVSKYKALEAERQQLELLLVHLDTEKNSSGDISPELEREIEITEERVEVAKRKMREIREDIGYA
jgi:hypothetical protein